MERSHLQEVSSKERKEMKKIRKPKIENPDPITFFVIKDSGQLGKLKMSVELTSTLDQLIRHRDWFNQAIAWLEQERRKK